MTYTGTCPDCGKRRYVSRTDAKKAARQHKGSKVQAYQAGQLSAYKCGSYWHLGHIYKGVALGIYDRTGNKTVGSDGLTDEERREAAERYLEATEISPQDASEARAALLRVTAINKRASD